MKTIVILFACICLGINTQAQQSGVISGQLQDESSKKRIDGAGVILFRLSDSVIVKTSLTDGQGQFRFEQIPVGQYLVKATVVSHMPFISKPIVIDQASGDLNLGDISLAPASKNLREVVVNAKKPFMERKADKILLHVDALISNTGTTALEVLERAPGVAVDKDGQVSLKGKDGVLILIDGKPSYLTGQELANYLRNMPSANLDQIEIMSNPPAKYDAAGNAGVINIKTKKNKQKGFNGSLSTSYGQGFYPKTNNSLNLNYRKGKFNIFSTLSANYRKGYQDLDIHRRYTNNDKSTRAIFDQDNLRTKVNKNFNGKIGLDFYLSPKTTLGFVASGISSPGNEIGSNTTFLKNRLGVTDSIVTATSSEYYTWKNSAVNFNIRHQFDSTGREFTVDLDYLDYQSGKDQYFVNETFQQDWTSKSRDDLRGELPSDIRIYSAKADYTHPFRSGWKLEAGSKISRVNTDNVADYFTVINGQESPDYDKTNRFKYEEDILAGYINMSREFKKWSVQAGLRAEHTSYSGKQFGNPARQDSSFSRQYNSLFPTVYLTYQPNQNHNLGFSYGRRISRPDYEDLNPFMFFLDKYTYARGNPFLQPMFSDVLEISHTYKKILTTTANLSRSRNLITETFEENGFATVVSPGNFGYMDNASLSVSAQLSPAKWWKAFLYTEARYQSFHGLLYGQMVDLDNTNWLTNINNQFSLGKGWTAELSGFYRTKGIQGQIIINRLGEVNAGLQKQVLKNKGSLKLSVRDMFYTRPASGQVNFKNTEASFRERNDSRVVSIGFNYRFGKPAKQAPKRKTGGAGEEQNRVKTAG